MENKVSRRSFVKGAFAAGAAAAVAGLAGCKDDEGTDGAAGPSVVINWDGIADVVIVGGGGAGCSCALAAAEGGKTVILLESSSALGGCTALAVGSLTTPGSKLQAEKGITDSAEQYLEDAKAHMLSAAAVERAGEDWAIFELQAAEGGKTIDWMVDHGVEFNGPLVYPHHTNDRMHMLSPSSAVWPGIFANHIEAAGGKIMLDTKGVELITEAGRVIGVKAVDQITKEELYFKANLGVFIASASIDGSYEYKLKAYADPAMAETDASCAFNDGSGLRMAQMIGADLHKWDSPAGPSLRSQAPSLNVAVYGKQSWMPYGMMEAGAILVTKQGKRYASEEVSGAEICIETKKLPEGQGWIFYDDAVAQNFQVFPDMVVSSMPHYGWGTVDDFVADGSIKKADTIEEVAELAGIDPAGLAAEVERYNGFVAAGQDDDFGRKKFGVEAAGTLNKGLNTPPYYIHGPQKGEVTSAHLTLMITLDFEVKDVFGDVIPGLYAGGNAGKGKAPMSIGHGTQLTWAFTSGRLAGEKFAAMQA